MTELAIRLRGVVKRYDEITAVEGCTDLARLGALVAFGSACGGSRSTR